RTKLQYNMNKANFKSIYSTRSRKSKQREVQIINRKQMSGNINIFTIINNPIFAFIASPILAYESLFNFMPSALLYSTILGSIMLTLFAILLLIPIVKIMFILKNISMYFYDLHLYKKSKLRY
ncbi:MAG: hypothetical protein Q7R95_03975, partial [bacterium]|nr:hypothetical protein [bacterium]